jgi:hypothetical protein
MLCQGCAHAVARQRTATTPTTDFWPGEHTPEGTHPLLAPLPPSVWRRYHSTQHTAAPDAPGYPNPHHQEMHGPDSPAAHEWYHGTSTSFEGPPKSATELMNDHQYWGNFGAGDWNNHIGSHWTSLHGMAKGFLAASSAGNRVIHAKLHMKNPVKYNSLDHMTHDAYERLSASGDMQDGGEHVGKHQDDAGDHSCCSGALLRYAKGEHRSDGKYGLERYRDSLRASGHDGILMRNNTDDPIGHWNAIPLSADHIQITNSGCNRPHHDPRDHDDTEFEDHRSKLLGNWQEEKPYHPAQYTHGKPLPGPGTVDHAHTQKKADTFPHLQPHQNRPDADPHTHGENLDELHEENEPSFGGEYCAHCDDLTDHTTEQHGKEHDLRHLETEHGYGPDHYLHHALQEMSPQEVADHHEHEHTTDFPSGDFPTHTHFPKEARMAGAMNKTAHDSGDGATIFHCPFCGSGQVIARSDRTTECEYCHACFTVQVQPQFPAFPQTIDGMPMQVPGMPGQIGGPPAAPPGADGTMPPGQDPMADPMNGGMPGEEDPAAQDEQDPAAEEDSAPPFAKGSMLRTASGTPLDWDNYLRHLAIRHADNDQRDAVIERVRGERR